MRNNKVGDSSPSDFETYYTAIIIRIVWHWQDDGYID